MPGLWSHSFYWSGSGDAGEPDPPDTPGSTSIFGGYPAWQSVVILGSGFGPLQQAWEWLRRRQTKE